MANYYLGKHASNKLAIPIPGRIQKILWIVILSVALLFLSTSAVYATGSGEDNVSDAPPHEQISDSEESTQSNELPPSQYNVNEYNVNDTDGFTISWKPGAGQTGTEVQNKVHYGTLNGTTFTSIPPFTTQNINRNYSSTTPFGTNNDTIYKNPHFDVRYFEETYTAQIQGEEGMETHKFAYAGSYIEYGPAGSRVKVDMTKFAFTNSTTLRVLNDLKNSNWSDPITVSGSVDVYLIWKDVTEWDQNSPDFTVTWTGNSTTPLPNAQVQYMYHDLNPAPGTSEYKHLDPPFAGNLELTRATSDARSTSHTMTMSNYTGRFVDQYIGKDEKGDPIYKPCIYSQAKIAVPTPDPKDAIWIDAKELFYSYMDGENRWFFMTSEGGSPIPLKDGQGGTQGSTYTGINIWINFIYEYNDDPTTGFVTQGLDSRGMGVKINVFDYDSWLNTSSSFSDAINEKNAFKFVSGTEGGTDNWNQYTGNGGRLGGYERRAGIWSSLLQSTGYPQLAVNTSENKDLTYLLDKYDYTYKRAYNDLTGLFDKSAYEDYGYFAFGSSDFSFTPLEGHPYSFKGHFAQIRKKSDGLTPSNESSNDYLRDDFVLYKNPSTGQAATDERLFMPFDDKDNGDVRNSDFHFGMTIETPFVQPKDGKSAYVGSKGEEGSPMIFHFNGDDDVFVFFDGVLFLDLGGIHQKVAGDVNFADGTVIISEGETGTTKTTLYIDELYKAATGKDPSQLTDEWEKVDGSTHYRYADFTHHIMKFYYFERGTGKSNCQIAFNLQSLPDGVVKVEKEVDKTGGQIGYIDGDFNYKVEVAAAGTENYQPYVNQPESHDLYYEVYDSETYEKLDTREPGPGGTIYIKDGQYAYLYGFHNNDKFKVAECDPAETTHSGEIDLLWDVWYRFGITEDYVKPQEKIEFTDGTKWYGTSDLVAGSDYTNVVKFLNKVNTTNLFDLKINKELSNKELSTIYVGFNGDTSEDTGEPTNTIPYAGKYDLLDKSGSVIASDLVTTDGIMKIEDEQTIMIKNLQMNTRATMWVTDPYRQTTYTITEYDPAQGFSTWSEGKMSNPYPEDYSTASEIFAARIPFINPQLPTPFPDRPKRYGLIKFKETNEADNLTIEKSVTGTEKVTGTSYIVGAKLLDDNGDPVNPALMEESYEAWFYHGENAPVKTTVTIDDEGQIKMLKDGEIVQPYIPKLASGDKLVIYGLIDKTNSPVKSLQATESNYSSWEDWSAKAKLNSLTEKDITGDSTDTTWTTEVISLPTLESTETEYNLHITNTFSGAKALDITFDFYQILKNNTSPQESMDQFFTYTLTRPESSGYPMPEGSVGNNFSFIIEGGDTTTKAHKDFKANTGLITGKHTYTYSAQYVSHSPSSNSQYKTDPTIFDISITVEPGATKEIIYSYKPRGGTAVTEATWTHELNNEITYDIGFDFYQILVNKSGAPMIQNYDYLLTATDGGPLPAELTQGKFTLEGGTSQTPKTLKMTAHKTGGITGTQTYNYTVKFVEPEPTPFSELYKLDKTIFDIKAELTEGTSAAVVTYKIHEGDAADSAGWTHTLNPAPRQYSYLFKFYQRLQNNTEDEDMDRIYNYKFSSITQGAPMPLVTDFTMEGGLEGEDPGVAILSGATVSLTPNTGVYTYKYSAKNVDTQKERYSLDTTTFNITVSIDSSKTLEEGAITTTFDPVSKNATWTHVLNPVGPEPGPTPDPDDPEIINAQTMDRTIWAVVTLAAIVVAAGVTLMIRRKASFKKYTPRHTK